MSSNLEIAGNTASPMDIPTSFNLFLKISILL